MAKSSYAPGNKFSMQKTKTGFMNTLYVMAGLFVGGLLEQHAMSKITILADTKADTSEPPKQVPNTVGIMLKSAIYIAGGLAAGQLTNNNIAQWAGYGLASYGGLKAVKSLSDSAKVFGLGSVHSGGDVSLPYYPQYQLQQQTIQSV